MAKRKKKATKEFSFGELTKSMIKVNPDSSLISESPYTEIENYISMGSYLLNAQVSGSMFKGIPEGRVIMLAGESGTGKTFLCLNITKAATDDGYMVYWFDTEAAVDRDMFHRFKINLDKVFHVPVDTVEKMTTSLANLATAVEVQTSSGAKPPKILVIIDSIGNLSTEKEVEDAIDGKRKADMTRTRELKKLFRVCTNKLGKLKIPVVATNHVYQSMSMYGGAIISGGSGPFYNASIILQISKSQLKEKEDGKDKLFGIYLRVKVKKSRFTQAGIDISIPIRWDRGMNKYYGLHEYVELDKHGIGKGKMDYKTGEYVEWVKGQRKYYAIPHLKKNIREEQMHIKEVFTDEVLEELDKTLKEIFEFPEDQGTDILEQMEEDIDDDDLDNDEL